MENSKNWYPESTNSAVQCDKEDIHISSKTPKHFDPNASAFYLKRLSVFKIRRGEFIFRLRKYKNKKSPSFLQELQTY
jgi:hypothetical protein